MGRHDKGITAPLSSHTQIVQHPGIKPWVGELM
jgi:hypothetical protein